MMRSASVNMIPGTAFFLTGDPDIVPSALLHNMKHNRTSAGRCPMPGRRVELVMDRVHVALSRMAADPTDFYHLPRDRVVELGERVAIRRNRSGILTFA